MNKHCEAELGQTRTSCQVNADPDEYQWRVEGFDPRGVLSNRVIRGTMSSARRINIQVMSGGGGGGSSPLCSEKPTQPCQDRDQEWVCEDGEWVCK
ncbi:MAG: hypothetical protein GVY30_00265 [Chloroflexi bacterium]|nr:hypothetical protein [Chloroflexota bacterium]